MDEQAAEQQDQGQPPLDDAASETPGAPEAQGAPDDAAPPLVRIVVAALKVLYSQPQTTQKIVQMLKSAPNPLQGIGAATALVLSVLQRQANGVDPALFQKVKPVVASEIIKIGVAAKVLDEGMLEQAASGAAQPNPQEQPQPEAAPETQPQPRGMLAGAMQGEPQ